MNKIKSYVLLTILLLNNLHGRHQKLKVTRNVIAYVPYSIVFVISLLFYFHQVYMTSLVSISIAITICTVTLCLSLILMANRMKGNILSNEKRYLSVSCNTGQLGNQLWPLISGWSIAKRLNRTLYTDRDCGFERNKKLLYLLFWTFPKLRGIIEEFEHPASEIRLPFSDGCCTYIDPLIHYNRTDKYLMLDTSYSQNVRYFEPFEEELLDLMEFGTEITDQGEKIMNERNIRPKDDVLCAHIRQQDFVDLHWATSLEESVLAVRYVAQIKPNRTLILFGDDRSFMEQMLATLQKTGIIGKNSFYSTYSEAEDLYIARARCKTFIATSENSSFGFWLSFMIGSPSSVYYLHTNRTISPQFDKQSRFAWKALRIVDGQVEQFNPRQQLYDENE